MSAQKCPDCGTWWQAAEHRCVEGVATDRTVPYPDWPSVPSPLPTVPEWWQPGGGWTCGGSMRGYEGPYTVINCASAA